MTGQLKRWTIYVLPNGDRRSWGTALEIIEIHRVRRPTNYVKSLAQEWALYDAPNYGPFFTFDIKEGSEY